MPWHARPRRWSGILVPSFGNGRWPATQLDLRRFELIMAEASKGNVGAIKELGRMIEANDRMDASRRMTGKDEAQKAQPAPKLGKKEAARQAAQDVGGDQSEWGNLLKPGYQVN